MTEKAYALPFQDDGEQLIAYATTMAHRQVGDRQELEDARQNALLRMMPALARVDRTQPQVKIRGYLKQFMVRGAQEHLQRWRGRSETEHDEAMDAARVDERSAAAELRDQVLAAIRRLPNEQRLVAARRWLHGDTVVRIAHATGLSRARVVEIETAAAAALRIVIEGGTLERRARKRRRAAPERETRGRKRLMARVRQIRPDAANRADVLEVERRLGFGGALVRRAWDYLPTHADCMGLFRWEPVELKGKILPHDDVDFERILDAFEDADLVVSYYADGKRYGWIRSFGLEHQPATKEWKRGPLYPEPDVPGYVRWRRG